MRDRNGRSDHLYSDPNLPALSKHHYECDDRQTDSQEHIFFTLRLKYFWVNYKFMVPSVPLAIQGQYPPITRLVKASGAVQMLVEKIRYDCVFHG